MLPIHVRFRTQSVLDIDMPATPYRIWQAIQDAKAKSTGQRRKSAGPKNVEVAARQSYGGDLTGGTIAHSAKGLQQIREDRPINLKSSMQPLAGRHHL